MFANENSDVFVPNHAPVEDALANTTHLAIGAHHDDLEIMAIEGILLCFGEESKWFTGVVVTDGAGSPRSGMYADYTDMEMMQVRVEEQKKAAIIGEYAAQVFLGYPSAKVKEAGNQEVVTDLVNLLELTSPEVVYTHNLADKHPTHIGVAVKTVEAIRKLDKNQRPKKLYGCEVWRDLGWMQDDDKVLFDCSDQANLQEALIGVFDSQISGGKRYDLAAMGRRLANATFFASHSTDQASRLVFGMDLTPLIKDDELDIANYVIGYLDRFRDDVIHLISSNVG